MNASIAPKATLIRDIAMLQVASITQPQGIRLEKIF
jgi:hypothetical protein